MYKDLRRRGRGSRLREQEQMWVHRLIQSRRKRNQGTESQMTLGEFQEERSVGGKAP